MKQNRRWQFAQKLEIQWWKRYLAEKNPADYLVWKKEYWNSLLTEINLSHLNQSNLAILDAGCGPAGIFIALESNKVKAIDPLLNAYKELAHFQPQNYPNTDFQALALEALDDVETYDYIFCLNAINHVADIQLCYDNLYRALKPGGTLVVSIDAHNSQLLKRIFSAIPGDALHPHQYDLKEYEQFLTDRKLQITQTLLKDKGRIFNYYVQVVKK